MDLAKPRIDIGLATNSLEAMLEFWQHEIGLPFDHKLPIMKGLVQYRHDALGSVLKINHYATPLPDAPPSGYRELVIARPGIPHPQHLTDPDGNRVCLVPPGTDGVDQIGMRMAIRNLEPHRGFYRTALGLAEEAYAHGAAFRAGESVVLLEEAADAPEDAAFEGPGWRYLTFQIFKVDAEHAHVLAHGGREGFPPRTLGTTARISMVRDPDGNWIELSQRASIAGTLE
jgi:lactoylglutathione lyase